MGHSGLLFWKWLRRLEPLFVLIVGLAGVVATIFVAYFAHSIEEKIALNQQRAAKIERTLALSSLITDKDSFERLKSKAKQVELILTGQVEQVLGGEQGESQHADGGEYVASQVRLARAVLVSLAYEDFKLNDILDFVDSVQTVFNCNEDFCDRGTLFTLFGPQALDIHRTFLPVLSCVEDVGTMPQTYREFMNGYQSWLHKESNSSGDNFANHKIFYTDEEMKRICGDLKAIAKRERGDSPGGGSKHKDTVKLVSQVVFWLLTPQERLLELKKAREADLDLVKPIPELKRAREAELGLVKPIP